jgi:dipeptidyl aminopeptidase/acylaminoacyl peptidase
MFAPDILCILASKASVDDNTAPISCNSGCPLLIIHGSADEDVPVENAHHLYEKAKAPKRLKIIEGGNHGFNDPAHLKQVISLTSDWLKLYL